MSSEEAFGADEIRTGREVVANVQDRRLIPGFGGRISAALVWDGGETVNVPAAMGVPRSDQMVGTARERLVEVALRVCYDSMGTGRSSEKCHEHIGQVKHYSVAEHAVFTVEFDADLSEFAADLLNHPCLWVEKSEGNGFRVTCNLRHAIDGESRARQGSLMHSHMLHHASSLAPQVVKRPEWLLPAGKFDASWSRVVEPESDYEKWVTLYVVGDRGWSHELVRHGDWTAISQRSTRYCEESESEWVLHPLMAKTVAEEGGMRSGGLATGVRTALLSWADKIKAALDPKVPEDLTKWPGFVEIEEEIREYANWWTGAAQLGMVAQEARIAYNAVATKLTALLKAKGIDVTTARKQARGAARGLLGNALETEVIFSFSVAQALHVLNMRAADAADATIRLGFAEAVLPCLRASRYGDRFEDLELAPAGDGIGRSLRGGGHR